MSTTETVLASWNGKGLMKGSKYFPERNSWLQGEQCRGSGLENMLGGTISKLQFCASVCFIRELSASRVEPRSFHTCECIDGASYSDITHICFWKHYLHQKMAPAPSPYSLKNETCYMASEWDCSNMAIHALASEEAIK